MKDYYSTTALITEFTDILETNNSPQQKVLSKKPTKQRRKKSFIWDRSIAKIVMKSDNKRMQKEEESLKNQTKLSLMQEQRTEAISWMSIGCLTQTLQLGNSWQWYQHNMNRRRTIPRPTREKKSKVYPVQDS